MQYGRLRHGHLDDRLSDPGVCRMLSRKPVSTNDTGSVFRAQKSIYGSGRHRRGNRHSVGGPSAAGLPMSASLDEPRAQDPSSGYICLAATLAIISWLVQQVMDVFA